MRFRLGSVLVAAALLLAACGDESEPAAGATPSSSPTAAGQALVVKDVWVKTAASGMSAVFGTLMNTGSAGVTLVKATSTASPMMELHEVATVDGEMMRPKEGGFTIPAGGTHELKPGGDHLMMMDVKRRSRPAPRSP